MSKFERTPAVLAPNSNRPPHLRERFLTLQEKLQNKLVVPILNESECIRQYDLPDPLNQEMPPMQETSDVVYEKMLPYMREELRKTTQNLRQAEEVVITTINNGIGDSIKGIREAHKIANTLLQFHDQEYTGIFPKITIVIPKVLEGVYQSNEMMSFVSDSEYFDHEVSPTSNMVLVDLGPFSQLEKNTYHNKKLLHALQTENKYIYRSQRGLEYFISQWYGVRTFLDIEDDSATTLFSAVPSGLLYAANLHPYIATKPSELTLPPKLPKNRFDCIFILDAREGLDKGAIRGDTPDNLSHDSLKSIAPETFYLSLPYQPDNKRVAIVMGVDHPEYCEEIINLARRFKPSWKITIVSGKINDLIEPMLASKTIVTTDNGIGHLANEVLIAAAPLGYKGKIRQVFNGDYVSPLTYGLANLPKNSGRILMVKTPGDHQKYDRDSLKLLDPKLFAEFIWRQR